MTPLNYNHLYYFYTVATEGSITNASKVLHLTPQTISGQISSFESQLNIELFERRGKKLFLSEKGQLVYSYCEEIFQLGDKLRDVIRRQTPEHWLTFTVGVAGVIPKVLAYQLLNPVLKMKEQIRLICREGDQETLLSELAVNKLDLVITDQAMQTGSHVKAYNHRLTDSGFSFFAAKKLASICKKGFPQSLSGQPFLMQGKRIAVRQRLSAWMEANDIVPKIVAEFDDRALMKSFGQEGYGVFAAPTLIEEIVRTQYHVEVIGRTDKVKEYYYLISPERRLKHPAILELVNSAQ